MTPCNLFAKSLVNNLRELLSKEMDLKSLVVLGLPFFGMMVMKESLMVSWFIIIDLYGGAHRSGNR
jgi:hypothetical protein